MIGHSLGRVDISYFLAIFRLYEVVSLHMCVLSYKYRKILEMWPKLTKLCVVVMGAWQARDLVGGGIRVRQTPTRSRVRHTQCMGRKLCFILDSVRPRL